MSKVNLGNIPPELQHPLFGIMSKQIFPEDYSFYTQKTSKKTSWKDETKLNDLIKGWKFKQATIKNQISETQTADIDEIKKALAIFLQFLFWSNGQPVKLNQLEESIELLEIKPINVNERIQFILQQPHSYHAYVQLNELMIEQQKILASYQTRKNNNKG